MIDLNKPTANDLLEFRNDSEAVKAAQSVIQGLRELAYIVTPMTIATIARQHFPGEPLQIAIAKLEIEVQQAHAEAVKHAAQFKSVSDSERDRLAPAMSSAVRRTFAIGERVEQIAYAIVWAKQDNETRRAKMQEARMSDAEIESLAPAVVDVSGLLAERECLNAELNILNAFLTTGDESCLPDGFLTVTELVKVSNLEKLAA